MFTTQLYSNCSLVNFLNVVCTTMLNVVRASIFLALLNFNVVIKRWL